MWPGYAGTITNLKMVLKTQNQATQKILIKSFLPQKIPKSKISNPKKSFDHPCHLESGVPTLWDLGSIVFNIGIPIFLPKQELLVVVRRNGESTSKGDKKKKSIIDILTWLFKNGII